MFTRKELLETPELYIPLSSIKSVRNKANDPDYTRLDLKSFFMSENNKTQLARNLYSIGRKNGVNGQLEKYQKLIPLAMIEFDKRYPIQDWDTVESTSTEQQDWAEILRVVNNQFIKFCYSLLKWDQFNPFRERVEVGAHGDRRMVKMSEVTAADIPTIDVAGDVEIQRMNKHFRYNNQVPVWQRSMHNRHYDTANEGLAQRDSDRASLNNPIYAMDISNVEAVMNNWTESGWFGL